MQTLQILYEIPYKNTLFFDRKITITDKKTILYGPRKSGKTHLIIDHLSHYDKSTYLYIDFSDKRVDPSLVAEHLPLFLKQHPITLLVIEHFDFMMPLPNLPEIILSTPFTCKALEGFSKLTLFPLDFEEFIAFDKKHSNIEQLFNLYANHGTFPHIVLSVEADHHRQMQSLLELILEPNTLSIYRRFCELQGSKVSLFQIYHHLKTFSKISKDKLYALTNALMEQQLLFLVEKFTQPRAPKKAYQIDFALKNAVTFKKDFLKRFENMVFLELIKRSKRVYYEEGIDFYIPEEALAVICVGFAPQEVIERRIQKLLPSLWSLHVKHIEVVTLSSESALSIEGMSFSISPFWEWALQG